MEYVGRYRREMRHGPGNRDKFHFAAALIFLTGAPPEIELKSNLPGMEEIGLWFGPRVVDLSKEDGVAHLEAIEQNRLSPGLLCWAPLMRGGQDKDFVRRWRVQAERMSEVDLRNTAVDLALTFSRLTDSHGVWHEGLEGLVVKRSPYWDEVRAEMRQQDTLAVLEARFPGVVLPGLVERVKAQTDLEKLGQWVRLASTAASPEAFAAGIAEE